MNRRRAQPRPVVVDEQARAGRARDLALHEGDEGVERTRQRGFERDALEDLDLTLRAGHVF